MADIKIYGKLVRDVTNDKIVNGFQVDGGFFTWNNTETPPTGSVGQLCSWNGTIYKYNGTSWIQEENFGGGSSDLIKYGEKKTSSSDVTTVASSVKIWTDKSGSLHINIT